MKANLEKYADKGFAIVGINLDNTAEAREKYIDQEELTWTNLVAQNEAEAGWNHPLANYYGVTGIPTAILVDKEGKVISLGARGEELDRLLAEQLGPAAEPAKEPSDDDANASDE